MVYLGSTLSLMGLHSSCKQQYDLMSVMTHPIQPCSLANRHAALVSWATHLTLEISASLSLYPALRPLANPDTHVYTVMNPCYSRLQKIAVQLPTSQA